MSSLLRAFADVIDALPAHTLFSIVIAAVPILIALLYRRFIHIPANERAVAFEWAVPPEAS